jgi:hypothetical protein
MKYVLIALIFLAFIFGFLGLSTQSFAQQTNLKNHPLTPVSPPIQIGNGTVFQTIIIFSTKPVEDVGLAEYNKAINFERVKFMILNATFSDKILKDIITDVEKQHDILQTKGVNVTKYYTNGSMTLSYSSWWMQSYVTSRLDQDGLQTIASNMNPGTSLHVTIDPIDREMQRIISNYNLNYSQPQPQSIPRNTTNIMASNLTRIQPYSSHLPILNSTVNNLTSIQAVKNNHTVVTNMSKVIPTVPEFPFAMLVFVIAIFSIIFIQRRNSNNY